MGTLARTAIIDGRKVLLQAAVPSDKQLSPYDASLLGSSAIISIAEKLVCREVLSATDIAELLTVRSIPVLLKLLSFVDADVISAQPEHTLFLPVDSWLDRMDPNAVVSRAIGHIRRQRSRPDRIVVEIKDFSDLEHLWPDILDEIRGHVLEHTVLVAPEPGLLMDWIVRHDRTGSRAVRKFQFEQKLNRLLEAGFDCLEPTVHAALLRQVDAVGFPVEAITRFSVDTPVEEMARELVRLTQNVGEVTEVALDSWTPSVDLPPEQPAAAEFNVQVLHAHLIGAILFPGVLQRVASEQYAPEVVQFLQAIGVPVRLRITADSRTAKRTGAVLAEAEQHAVVLSGSFCSNENH
jgi:hypothetical protein